MGPWGGARWASVLSGRGGPRSGLAVVVVVGVILAAFGTGFGVTRALTNNDSAWMRKGDTIVHINGPSGRFDAVVGDHPVKLASSARDDLELIQTPDGHVYTVNPQTHQVYGVDLSAMTPLVGPSGNDVLANGGKSYVVNNKNSTLTPFDPKTMASGTPIPIPGHIASQAIGPDGVAYLGLTDGSVTTVRNGQAQTAQVAPKGSGLVVTVVGNQPVAVDGTGNRAYLLDSSGKPAAIALGGPSGAPVQVSSALPGGPLVLVRGDSLVSVDLAQGQSTVAGLTDRHNYGLPVVNDGRVYVPDDTAGQVLVYHAGDLSAMAPIAVPAGAPGVANVETFAQDGRVWIDNPSSQDAKVVNPDGTTQTIDKGSGNQVVNPNAPAVNAPAANTPAANAPAANGPATSAPPTPTPGPLPAPTPVPVATPTPPAPPAVPIPGPSPSPPPPATKGPPTSPSPPPVARGSVPSLKGMDPATACATLRAAVPPLTCSQKNQGEAPANTHAGVVFNQSPGAGVTVGSGTSVTISYYSSLPMPAFQSGEAPGAYCQAANRLGVNCTPADLGQGPAGTQTNVVAGTSPTPNTAVAVNQAVHADYYSTAASPPPPPPAPGTVAVPFAEFSMAGVTGVTIYYLSTNPAPPTGFTPTAVTGYAFPVTNGGCTAPGTVLLYHFVYNTVRQQVRYVHHYYTTNAGWATGQAGWSADPGGPVACVYTGPVAGSQPVYEHYIAGSNPADHSWELAPGNGATLAWYQPTT